MNVRPIACLALSLLVIGSILFGAGQPSAAAEHLVGGYSEVSTTNEQVIAAAKFAVTTFASAKHDAEMRLDGIPGGILKAEQQVVAGINYRLRLKVKAKGTIREADAVVWRKLSGEHQLTSWTWRTEHRLEGSWMKHHAQQEDHAYSGDTNVNLEVTFQANGQFLWNATRAEGTNTVDESVTGTYFAERGMITYLFDKPSDAARKQLPEWFAFSPSQLKGQQSFRFEKDCLVLEHEGNKLWFYMQRKLSISQAGDGAVNVHDELLQGEGAR
jgi:hypothetical protein